MLIDGFGSYESERYVGSCRISSQRRGDVAAASDSQQANHRVSYCGKNLGSRPGPHLASVFVEGNVSDPVQSVLDAPMLSRQFQQSASGGLVRAETRDRV